MVDKINMFIVSLMAICWLYAPPKKCVSEDPAYMSTEELELCIAFQYKAFPEYLKTRSPQDAERLQALLDVIVEYSKRGHEECETLKQKMLLLTAQVEELNKEKADLAQEKADLAKQLSELMASSSPEEHAQDTQKRECCPIDSF